MYKASCINYETPLCLVHIFFCKFVLGVGKYSSDIATKAELGRYPIAKNAITHSLKYWLTLNNKCIPNFDKKFVFLSTNNNHVFSSFDKHIQALLTHMGYNHVCVNKTTFSINALICSLKLKFREKYINYFKHGINNPDSKLRTYRLFKSSYHMENYIMLNVNKQLIYQLARFRISNHCLAIERGRFATKNKDGKYTNTPTAERLCKFCIDNAVEDKLHFMVSCSLYDKRRQTFFNSLNDLLPDFVKSNSTEQFIFLLSTNDTEILNLLIHYILMIGLICEKLCCRTIYNVLFFRRNMFIYTFAR